MEDDVSFFFCQFPERHVCPDSEFSGDILHQRPHQGLPGKYCALINRQGFVRDKRRFVNDMNNSGSVTAGACPLAVKGEFLRSGAEKMRSAFRAYHFLLQRDTHRRRKIVAIWASVAAEPGKHQTK